MITKKYNNLVSVLANSDNDAFTNHIKMVKYLDEIGIVPNPVQRVAVGMVSYQGIPAQQKNSSHQIFMKGSMNRS